MFDSNSCGGDGGPKAQRGAACSRQRAARQQYRAQPALEQFEVHILSANEVTRGHASRNVTQMQHTRLAKNL